MKTRRSAGYMIARAHYVWSRIDAYVDRIEIVGSLRRGASEVADIEILCVPKFEDVPSGLFGENEPVNLLHIEMAKKLASGEVEHRYGKDGKGAFGPRFMRLLWVVPESPELGEERVPVDLFVCLPPAQWGVLKVIRTGPAEFSKQAMTQGVHGGMLPMGMRVEDGRILDRGVPLETPDEETFFKQIGVEFIRPEDRA